jgi:class 3 adenylate cyclase
MASVAHSETFDVSLPVDRTWEVMADTQHLNQLFFGLGAMRIVSRDGEKAHVKGGFGVFAPEYDEYPWVFEVPNHYKSVRVFTRGLVKRLEVECKLVEQEKGTQVNYALKCQTIGGPIGAIAASVLVRRTKRGLADARKFLSQLGGGALPNWPPANPQREAVLMRAKPLAEKISAEDADEKRALDEIVTYLADAAEPDVARMRPYALAESWNLNRKKTLAAFLRATKGGLLRLSWDLLCPSCEAPTSVESLKELPKGGHCPACDIDFTTSFEQNVEATFSPEPVVRAAERLVFCHGSPASTKSWLAQFVVLPSATHELALKLGRGRYRLQAAGIQGQSLIDVEDEGDESARVSVEKIEGKPVLPGAIPVLKAGKVKIVVDNKDVDQRRMQLAHRAFASKAATAADVTAIGLFRELFGGEALAPDQHVQIGQRAIMFTDLVGSTSMYERMGDAAAYGLVREHFRLLFAEIEKEGGRVVKTVGDAVMAAFDDPLNATKAAKNCILALRTLRDKDGNAPGLKLRVGVHAGACLAIEANGLVDYFGRTVNIAARVESLAGADELVVSWAAAETPEVMKYLDDQGTSGDTVTKDRKPVKGVDGDVVVVRLLVNSRGTQPPRDEERRS